MGRQTAPVPCSAIRPNINEPPDVVIDLAAEITLNHEAMIYDFADPVQVRVSELVHLRVTVHIGLLRDPARQGVSNAIDTGESNLYPLVIWNIDVCNTCHVLSLPLFVPRVCANNPQHPAALDLSAFITPGFD
jgi:hypothetical protein